MNPTIIAMAALIRITHLAVIKSEKYLSAAPREEVTEEEKEVNEAYLDRVGMHTLPKYAEVSYTMIIGVPLLVAVAMLVAIVVKSLGV